MGLHLRRTCWLSQIVNFLEKKECISDGIGSLPINNCGDWPKIIGWLGRRPVQERSSSEETSWPKQSLFRPTGAKRTCPRSNFASNTAKSGSKARPNHYSPFSKYVKRKKTRDISAKAATTTLNALQLLSWPH